LRGYGELVSLYLLPEYFGRGYGTKLLNAALAGLSDLGYKDIFLWVLEENLRAVHFYEKYGFRKSGAYLDDTVGGRILRERQYIYYGIRPRPFP
ncbi:MAG: GNAT family N-acetyltransferase, partial [Oscillospiraceae bacterium]|nr:GNAT family N-acetyltransferase [Oscillospiraceae bacterium]